MKGDGTVVGTVMAREMGEQPDRLSSLIERRAEICATVAPLFSAAPLGTVIVARGSSDHAATTGRYLIEMATRRPVSSASPSVQTLYGIGIDYEGYVVIAVSQSGRTPEIAEVLSGAGRQGARTIAITNDASSPLAAVADAVIDLRCGAEEAVPATKTVTAEMCAFALIGAAVGLDPGAAAFDALPGQAGAILDDLEPMQALAEWLADAVRLAIVARGPLHGAAAETALKLQETTSLLAAPFSAADLRHGPIALATSAIRVLAMVHPGPAAHDVLSLSADLVERGADVRIIGPVPGAVCGWDAGAPESLAPVLATIRGQQLALGLSRVLGLDPDSPRGLTKVTVT